MRILRNLFCRSKVIPTLSVVLLLSAHPLLHAEHAVIDLQVVAPHGKAVAASDQEPPLGGVNPRPKVIVHAKDPLVMQFILRNVYPHGVLKNVKVRYFVAKEAKVGQREVPPLKDNVVVRGTVVMNLKPRGRVGARYRFHIDVPGVYLLRVDTHNTRSDHEHFAAIDVVVK